MSDCYSIGDRVRVAEFPVPETVGKEGVVLDVKRGSLLYPVLVQLDGFDRTIRFLPVELEHA